MQILINAHVIKVHCDADIIVSLIHPTYSKEEVDFIKPFLIRACKTKRGITINGWTIKGGERGWFYIKRADCLMQTSQLMLALLKQSNDLPYPKSTLKPRENNEHKQFRKQRSKGITGC